MRSTRKLEEKIAKTKDPVIQKKLQELIDKRTPSYYEKRERRLQLILEVSRGLCIAGLVSIIIISIWVLIYFFLLRSAYSSN